MMVSDNWKKGTTIYSKEDRIQLWFWNIASGMSRSLSNPEGKTLLNKFKVCSYTTRNNTIVDSSCWSCYKNQGSFIRQVFRVLTLCLWTMLVYFEITVIGMYRMFYVTINNSCKLPPLPDLTIISKREKSHFIRNVKIALHMDTIEKNTPFKLKRNYIYTNYCYVFQVFE